MKSTICATYGYFKGENMKEKVAIGRWTLSVVAIPHECRLDPLYNDGRDEARLIKEGWVKIMGVWTLTQYTYQGTGTFIAVEEFDVGNNMKGRLYLCINRGEYYTTNVYVKGGTSDSKTVTFEFMTDGEVCYNTKGSSKKIGK